MNKKEYFYYCAELNTALTSTLKTKGAVIVNTLEKDVFKKPFPDNFMSLFEMKEKGFKYEYIGEI